MSYALNNVTTRDGYIDANTLQNLEPLGKVNGQVANAAVFVQLQHREGTVGPSHWDPEVFVTPQVFSWARGGVCGVRVRSATAGAPAQVTLELS